MGFFNTPVGQHGKHIKIKNLKHSFTKWDKNPNVGLTERTPEWVCQVCGDMQPEAIDPFVLPITDREFLRICSLCERIRFENSITTFEILIEIRRKKDQFKIYG